jgi:hypothetical protein
MRALLLAAFLGALAIPQESRDLPGLAIAIVEAARKDIGLGPDATHPPVASGPFYIDEQSFVAAFNRLAETAGADVRNALIAHGYASESLGNLLRQQVDSLGLRHYWLANDAILLRLHGMNTSEYEVIALVTYYYTFEGYIEPPLRVACPRQLRIRLLFEDGAWHAVETKVVGQC